MAARLFGRARELEALAAHQASGARLVTIVGPPGVGKTRLARQFMASCPDLEPCFIDLSEARFEEDVLHMVAHGLSITLSNRDSISSSISLATKSR